MQFYRSLQSIKAITFDLDDTLYDNVPVIERMESLLTHWLHQQYPLTMTVTPEWWQQQKKQIVQKNPELSHDVTLWRRHYMQQGLRELGYSQVEAELAAQQTVAESLRLRSDFSVPSASHHVLKQLAQRVPLIAITNGNVDVERIGLAPYFQHVLQAGKNGRSKPYPDLFEQAQTLLNLPASNILHVGDHPISDVLGALNSGFMACWFHDKDKQHQMRLLPHIEIQHLESLLLL